MTTECTHNWKLGPAVGGIVHGRCLKCGEERDFPQYGDPAEPGPRHTPQISSQAPKRDHSQLMERHRFYEEHKEEILADLQKLGRPATLKKWNVPGGTMVGLLIRWGRATPPPPPADKDALGYLDLAIGAAAASIRSLEEKRREFMRGAGRTGGEIYHARRRLKELQHARAILLEVIGKGDRGEPDQDVRR